MSGKSPLILLAAGGTGGHVFPAEALARELLARTARVALVTDKRGGGFSDDLILPVHQIYARALGKGFFRKIWSVALMGVGVLQAARLIRRLKPDAVVGFGGYPSVPLLYAAAQAGVPIILHEQNAVLGRANRALAPLAKVLATSFPHVQGAPRATKARILRTGNPVRPAFAALRSVAYPVAEGEDGPLRLLILGGSLGASIFSKIVPQALAELPKALRARLFVTQQCRTEDLEAARAAYAGIGVEAELAPFFKDVPERMARTHLVIGRSGGGAVSELTAIGRPSILVPYPHGHAGEQVANAEALAEAGGAWMIPQPLFTPEALAVRLGALFALPSSLAQTAAAARAWGTVTAADALAEAIYETLGQNAPRSAQARACNPDPSGREGALALSTREHEGKNKP